MLLHQYDYEKQVTLEYEWFSFVKYGSIKSIECLRLIIQHIIQLGVSGRDISNEEIIKKMLEKNIIISEQFVNQVRQEIEGDI